MDVGYLKEIISISPFTLVSTSLVLFLGILYIILKDKRTPPGPRGLPYLGIWPFLRNDDIHLQFADLVKKYGDVFSFTVMGRLFIHLGSTKSVRELQGDSFLDRFSDYSVLTILFPNGVALANKEKWRVLRKFFVQTFKDYGITTVRDYMTGPIYDSVNAAVDSLKATKGSPINIVSLLNNHTSFIIRRMMFNDSEMTEEELKKMLEAYQFVMVLFTGKTMLLMGQFARYFIYPFIDGYKLALEKHELVKDYLRIIIRRHEKTYNKGNIRDIIDSYIKERNDREEKGDPTASFFTEEGLVDSLSQIVVDGSLSISVLAGYFIRALLDYPEEQDKIYQELEDVIGPDRNVTLEDRSKLPYTNAFMLEVLRTSNFLYYFPNRICTKETAYKGYKIPKGSITILNMWAAQHDPDVYDEPNKFMPSRYIQEAGKPKPEAPVLFGIGKRSCIGESFTMMQIFLFITTFVKNFRLDGPKGDLREIFVEGKIEVCAYPRKN